MKLQCCLLNVVVYGSDLNLKIKNLVLIELNFVVNHAAVAF